jgi:hypothetical protein
MRSRLFVLYRSRAVAKAFRYHKGKHHEIYQLQPFIRMAGVFVSVCCLFGFQWLQQ